MIEVRAVGQVHECYSQTIAKIFIHFCDEDKKTVLLLPEGRRASVPMKMVQMSEGSPSLSF